MKSILKPAVVFLSLTVIVIVALYPARNQGEPVRPWPGREIRVENRAGFFAGVWPAIQEINRAGLGVRMVLTERDPDVIIRSASRPALWKLCGFRCIGLASSIGYRGRREEVLLDREFLESMPTQQVVLHELGHILGLDHLKSGCGMMYPGDGERYQDPRCASVKGYERCGFSSVELKELARLYGRRGVYSPWCPTGEAASRYEPSLILSSGQEISFAQAESRRSQASSAHRSPPGYSGLGDAPPPGGHAAGQP